MSSRKLLKQATEDETLLSFAGVATKLFVEFFGTFMLVLIIIITVALDPLGALANGVVAGFALFALIMFASGTSGGHFNPYVTWAMFLSGYMPGGYTFGSLALTFLYTIVQLFGGLVAAWTFLRAGPPTLAPAIPSNLLVGDFSGVLLFEFLGVLLLVLVVLHVSYPGGKHCKHGFGPLAIGAVFIALMDVLTLVGTGASMNFARSLGPAIVSNTYTGFGAYPAAGALGVVGAVILHLLIRGAEDPKLWTKMFAEVLRDVRLSGSSSATACARQ